MRTIYPLRDCRDTSCCFTYLKYLELLKSLRKSQPIDLHAALEPHSTRYEAHIVHMRGMSKIRKILPHAVRRYTERDREREREIHNFSTFHSHLKCSRRNSIVPHSGAHRAAEWAKRDARGRSRCRGSEKEVQEFLLFSEFTHIYTHIIILDVTAATPGLPKKSAQNSCCMCDRWEREAEIELQKGIEEPRQEALELGPGSVGRLQSQRQRLICLSWSYSTAATSAHATKQAHTDTL